MVDLAGSNDLEGRVAGARRFRELAAGLESESAVAGLIAAAAQGGVAAAPALRLLATLDSEAATRHLLAAAQSSELSVSQTAQHALVNMVPSDLNTTLLLGSWKGAWPESARFMLARALAKQPGAVVRDWAAALLHAPPGPEYVDPVVRDIVTGSDPDIAGWLETLRISNRPGVRLAVAGARLLVGHTSTLDELLEAARSGRPALRKQALWWLTGAPFVAVEPVFVAALQDSSAALREFALLGLPFVSSPVSIPQAAALLSDPKPAVVHQAGSVYWLLTGNPVPNAAATAVRQAIQIGARLPPGCRCLQGKPLAPSALAALLPHPSYAPAAVAALRMLSPPVPELPEFRADCDLIRNVEALAAWQAHAQLLDQHQAAGGRYYLGSPV